jgi:hypothetical protein
MQVFARHGDAAREKRPQLIRPQMIARVGNLARQEIISTHREKQDRGLPF